jgi:predicted N-formylglutamate amidohydrolase
MTPLLGPDDLPPFIVENEGAASPFVLICDHAGRAAPKALGRLGVSDADFERHIAWDIGAGALASRLSAMLDAVAIRQTYSRLVIDCNRPPGSPELIVERSDGTYVPGNLGLTPEQAEQRLAEIHRPYHDRIAEILRARAAAGWRHVLILLHSFTPRMRGFDRPWRYGVLHLNDSPLSSAMLARLQAELGEAVGDNQPYAMDGTDYTAPRHSRESGFDYLELEVRQDLIGDEAGQKAVAQWLAPILRDVVGAIS